MGTEKLIILSECYAISGMNISFFLWKHRYYLRRWTFFFSPFNYPSPPPFLCLVALENALVMNCYSNVPGLLLVLVLFPVWLCVYVQVGDLRVPSVTTFYSNTNFHVRWCFVSCLIRILELLRETVVDFSWGLSWTWTKY